MHRFGRDNLVSAEPLFIPRESVFFIRKNVVVSAACFMSMLQVRGAGKWSHGILLAWLATEFFDLHDARPKLQGVVLVHRTLVLQGKNQIEILFRVPIAIDCDVVCTKLCTNVWSESARPTDSPADTSSSPCSATRPKPYKT